MQNQDRKTEAINFRIKLTMDLCEGLLGQHPSWPVIRKTILTSLNEIKRLARGSNTTHSGVACVRNTLEQDSFQEAL